MLKALSQKEKGSGEVGGGERKRLLGAQPYGPSNISQSLES